MSDTDTVVFLRMLADAESALAGDEDDRQWAADICVPELRQLIAESDELFSTMTEAMAARFDAVVSQAKALVA